MSDYPNMHYCRFENTYRALQQIRRDLLNPPQNLSESEIEYRNRILGFMGDVADKIELDEFCDEYDYFDDCEA